VAAATVEGTGMRICVLAYSFYEIDTRILQYTRAALDRGDQIDVIALRRPGQPDFGIVDGANVYRIQERTVNEKGPFSYLQRILRFMVHAAWVLNKLNRTRKYEVVHVHSVPDFLIFAAFPAKMTGARLILDIHDILPEFYASKFGVRTDSLLFKALTFVEKISARFADWVIIANDIWKDRILSRSVPESKCTTFTNYPDPTLFQFRSRSRSDGKFVLLYPGSLNWHQGLDIAIRAFAQSQSELKNAEFHIYGEGSAKPDLIELVKTLGLRETVIFHDWSPLPEVVEAMSNADLSVVPKRASSIFGTEAASTKIMEFMTMGVPVIVSSTRVDRLYHDDSRVEFFESENIDQLASTIVRLSKDSKRREEMIQNGFKYVRANSWQNKKKDYLRLIDVLGSRTLHSGDSAPVPKKSVRESTGN
jgi:glycosyltransferase involved in cell wall biosynthesis